MSILRGSFEKNGFQYRSDCKLRHRAPLTLLGLSMLFGTLQCDTNVCLSTMHVLVSYKTVTMCMERPKKTGI